MLTQFWLKCVVDLYFPLIFIYTGSEYIIFFINAVLTSARRLFCNGYIMFLRTIILYFRRIAPLLLHTIEVRLSETPLYEPVFVYGWLCELVTESLLSELNLSTLSVIRTRIQSRTCRCIFFKLIYNLTQFTLKLLINLRYLNVNFYYRNLAVVDRGSKWVFIIRIRLSAIRNILSSNQLW